MSAQFVCPRCRGLVKNIPDRRHSEEQLREIHYRECPR